MLSAPSNKCRIYHKFNNIYHHSRKYAPFSFFTDIDNCADRPCQNHGTCNDLVNSYTCTCIPGFTGRNCTQGKPMTLKKESKGVFKQRLKASLLIFSIFSFFESSILGPGNGGQVYLPGKKLPLYFPPEVLKCNRKPYGLFSEITNQRFSQ